LAKIPDPWPAVRDPGALNLGSCVLADLLGVRIRGPGPMGRVPLTLASRHLTRTKTNFDAATKCAVPAPSYMQGWGDSVGEHARILAFAAKI